MDMANEHSSSQLKKEKLPVSAAYQPKDTDIQ